MLAGRYMVSPDLRGEKLEEVYNGGDIQFFKKFWSIAESGIAQVLIRQVESFIKLSCLRLGEIDFLLLF